MIVYKKTRTLRTLRADAPEAPFWAGTTVAPYSARRGEQVSVDFLTLKASYAERLEVGVCDGVRGELEAALRKHPPHDPVLIDASGFAEVVFERGGEALKVCAENEAAAIFLASTRGSFPAQMTSPHSLAIAAWPLDFAPLDQLFTRAAASGVSWGVVVPVIFPVTTNLAALNELADAATSRGATFFAAVPVEVDPTAKQAMARSLTLDEDDETYASLFHSDLETIHIATERHIAALAHECGMADFVVPPHFDQRSNWNAAILLSLTASRMLAMKRDVELAWSISRAGRAVATLEKPLTLIAASASLAIIPSLDETAIDILAEWLETGASWFTDRIAKEWRLRRDHGMQIADALDDE